MPNENSGVLFPNDRKERENQPDMTGRVNVDGVEKRLAGWWREGKNGKFLSIKVSEWLEKPGTARQPESVSEPEPTADEAVEFDDRLPF